MNLRTEKGRVITIGSRLAEGGEGTIFEVKADRDHVVKLYHRPIPPARLQKLRCMIDMRSTELSAAAAWVESILFEGNVAKGLLLPKIGDAHDIHMLYGPSHRAQWFPSADWPTLVRVAANCCVVFDKIHRAGVVVGDVNHSNLLVSKRDYRVWLIDCDSCQISRNGERYLCEVGVPEFTPPELQGKSFTGTLRTPQQDAFGLAILIFHLLMMGRHPFAGRYAAGDVTLDQAIRRRLYAYSRDAQSFQMQPPPRTVPLHALSNEILNSFEKAFRGRPEDRPSPESWYHSLTNLLTSMVTCSAHCSHKYWSGSKECPWCALLRAGVPEYFVQVVFTGPMHDLLSKAAIDKKWADFQAILFPTLVLQKVEHKFRPSAEVLDDDLASGVLEVKATTYVTIGGLVTALIGIMANASLVSLGGSIIATLFFLWNQIARLNAPHLAMRSRLSARLDRASGDCDRIQQNHQEWLRQQRNQFDSTRHQADDFRQQLFGLAAKQTALLNRLEQQKKETQLHDYLRTKFLESATIDKIGPGRLAVLLSYGVETAADVSREAVLAVPGFGPILTEQLLSWRNQVTSGFRFDPTKGVTSAAKDQVRRSIIQEQNLLLRSLDQQLGELRAIISRVEARHQAVQEEWNSQQMIASQTALDLSYLRHRFKI